MRGRRFTEAIVRSSVEEDCSPTTPQLAAWLRLIFTTTALPAPWEEKAREANLFLDIVNGGPVTSLTFKGHSKTDR